MKLVKKSLLLLGAALLVTLPAYSQNDNVFEDDIYTSKKEIRKKQLVQQAEEAIEEYEYYEDYDSFSDEEIDAYNRRGQKRNDDGKRVEKKKKKKRSSVPGRYSRRLARFYKPNTIIISDDANVYVTDDGERFAYGDEYYDDGYASDVNVYINVNTPWYDPFPYTAWYPSFCGWTNYTWNYPWFYYGSYIGWGGYYPGYNWYWSWHFNPYHNPYGIGYGFGFPYGYGSYYGWGGYPGGLGGYYAYYPKETYSNGQHSSAYYANGHGWGRDKGQKAVGRYDRLTGKKKSQQKQGLYSSNSSKKNKDYVRPKRTRRANRSTARNIDPIVRNNRNVRTHSGSKGYSSGRNVRTERPVRNHSYSNSSQSSNRGSYSSSRSSSTSRSSGRSGGGRSGRH